MVRYARDFPALWTSDRILEMAARPGCFAIPAPTVDTNDVAFWRERIEDLNRTHLGSKAAPHRESPPPPSVPDPLKSRFPILDLDVLCSLPKAGKRQDMERILESPRSEDYVTWNVARILDRIGPEHWWSQLVDLADILAPDAAALDPADLPQLSLWEVVPPPPDYETASRKRMRTSDNPEWQQRASISDPVEGDSEIDMVLSGDSYLIYVEAKLDSDISLRTTYDPDRNQIVRNIDCLLEHADDRQPRFWMLVKDRHSTRTYMDLITRYQQEPEHVGRLLPHRQIGTIETVATGLAVITWSELLDLLPAESDAANVASVIAEIRRRISER